MQSKEANSIKSNVYEAGRHTTSILIIDDDGRLRTMFCRYILLEAVQDGRSCAIYHLSETKNPQLTWFEAGSQLPDPNSSLLNATQAPQLDFAIYEAASPLQAFNWLRTKPVRQLTIVSDVMMPTSDSQLSLAGFLEQLATLALPVNLLFASSDNQNRDQLKPLLAPSQPFHFVTKGDTLWSELPRALVKQTQFFAYSPVKLNSTY